MAQEMGGFVFAVIFIVFFATLLSSIPAGLQGAGETANDLTNFDPTLITGFDDYENWTKAEFSSFQYAYTLNSRQWVCFSTGGNLALGAKVIYAGFLWLGQYDFVSFGERGTTLTFDHIEADAEEGQATYPLTYVTNGNSAGTFIAYWNETEYADPEDAWDNEELYLVHGVGFGAGATNNIGALVIGLLFFSLPEVPTLINIFISTPLWACIIYVTWFLIKEMIPFV